MDYKEFHNDSLVLDWHNHIALKSYMYGRELDGSKLKMFSKWFLEGFQPLSARNTLPKLKEGGYNVVLNTAFIPEAGWYEHIGLAGFLVKLSKKTRQRIADPTYFEAYNMQLDWLEDKLAVSDESFDAVVCKTPEELRSTDNKQRMAFVHAIEGAHALQHTVCGKEEEFFHEQTNQEMLDEAIANLRHFKDRGVAYLTLQHFYPNITGQPVFPYPEYAFKHSDKQVLFDYWDHTRGLTEYGRVIVEEMLDLGMIVDIAHCTPLARQQVFEIVDSKQKDSCVINSHGGCFDINPDPYNLTNSELGWFRDHGCTLGVILMNYWISPIDTPLGLKYIERTINHIIKHGGEEVPALGSDLDGFTDPPDEIQDASQLNRLTRYLLGQRYSERQVKGFLGENGYRQLLRGWK